METIRLNWNERKHFNSPSISSAGAITISDETAFRAKGLVTEVLVFGSSQHSEQQQQLFSLFAQGAEQTFPILWIVYSVRFIGFLGGLFTSNKVFLLPFALDTHSTRQEFCAWWTWLTLIDHPLDFWSILIQFFNSSKHFTYFSYLWSVVALIQFRK